MSAGQTGGSILRAYRPEDLTAVHALICRTIDACYTGAYPPAAVAYFKEYHSLDTITTEAEQGGTVVLQSGDRIVGVGALVGTTVKRVFVDPERQHQGLGRRIMAHLESLARDRGVTTVELDTSLVSKRFYDSLGYESGPLLRTPVEHYRMMKELR